MKKNLFIAALMLVSGLAVAKNHTVIIRKPHTPIGETEVTESGSDGQGSDTLVVRPYTLATYIEFSVSNAYDQEIYLQRVAPNVNWIYHIDMPDLQDGYFFRIRDDKGVAYTDYIIK